MFYSLKSFADLQNLVKSKIPLNSMIYYSILKNNNNSLTVHFFQSTKSTFHFDKRLVNLYFSLMVLHSTVAYSSCTDQLHFSYGQFLYAYFLYGQNLYVHFLYGNKMYTVTKCIRSFLYGHFSYSKKIYMVTFYKVNFYTHTFHTVTKFIWSLFIRSIFIPTLFIQKHMQPIT